MTDYSYERQNLRHGKEFVERRLENVDPRTYLRFFKRNVQSVKTKNGFKYATFEPDGENPRIASENVGSRSGRVEGRLIARTNWKRFAGHKTEEETVPWAAIAAGAFGLLLVPFSFLGNDVSVGVLALAVVLFALAGYLYYNNEPNVNQSEYYYRKRVRLLLQGEVSEREAETNSSSIAASDLSVMYREDFEIEYRDTSGSRSVEKDSLPSEVQEQLDTSHTPLKREIDIEYA